MNSKYNDHICLNNPTFLELDKVLNFCLNNVKFTNS